MYRILPITLSSLFLVACGSEQSSTTDTVSVDSFNLTDASADDAGKLLFTWDGDSTDLTYTVCEKDITAEDNCSPLTVVEGVNSTSVHIDALLNRMSSEFFILGSNGSSSTASHDFTLSSDNITHLIRYLKASNAESSDRFGDSITLSGDGYTLAVGAYTEDSGATGVNSDLQSDNSASASGAVYVFKYDGTDWTQEAYLKSSNSLKSNKFGESVSLNEDGTVLAVGSIGEDSSSTGINSEPNEDYNSAGAVYVFRLSDNTWTEEAYVKASNTSTGDNFGLDVSLSDDGTVLAVGAKSEDSNAKGIYVDEESVSNEQADGSETSSGAAYIYRYDGSNWSQEAYVKASNTESKDYFGNSLSLSGDGNTLAVGAYGEDSNGTDGEDDNSLSGSGATYLFKYDGTSWAQQALIKAGTPSENSYFGNDVSLSEDGTTLAVGAYSDDSTFSNGGAVHVFRLADDIWSEQAYLAASNIAESINFGRNVSLSADGNTLVASADSEASLATGINGDETSSDKYNGAAYAFKYADDSWVQYAYIKASNTREGGAEAFGASLSLSSDGETLVVGAKNEDSASQGVDADQTDVSASAAGAVYIY